MAVPHQNLARERTFPTLWLDENFASLDASIGEPVGNNILYNGGLQIWQVNGAAGLTSVSGNNYGPDGYKLSSIGTTYTITRGTTGVGTEIDLPKYYASATITSVGGAANFCYLQIPLEDVTRFAGKQLTLAFRCASGGAAQLAVELEQNFGTGGSPSATVQTFLATVNIDTSFADNRTVTFVVPSISGKVLGSNGDDFLNINIWMDAGSNYNARTNSLGQHSGQYNFGDFRLNYGNVAIARNNVNNLATELLKCQRYFFKTFFADTAPAANLGFNTGEFASNQLLGANIAQNAMWQRWPTQMRIAPAITRYCVGAAGTQVYTEAVGPWSGTSENANVKGIRLVGTSPGGSSAGIQIGIHLTASALL